VEVLSFSHHQIVAGQSPAVADELLAWCLKGPKPRSTRELADELTARVYRARPPPRRLAVTVRYRPLLPPLPLPPAALPLRVIPHGELDTSPVGGPVPDELRNLQVDPTRQIDRVAIARAAISNVTFEEALQIFAEWLDSLSPEQRACAGVTQ
jgi:hypothetical protein